jgi:hypothetical protein
LENWWEDSSLDVYAKLSQLELNTFSSMKKEAAVTVDKDKVGVESHQSLFAQIIVISQSCLLHLTVLPTSSQRS